MAQKQERTECWGIHLVYQSQNIISLLSQRQLIQNKILISLISPTTEKDLEEAYLIITKENQVAI